MTEIQLNMYHALALGAAMYALGLVLTKKIPVFSRFCIPAPLVGGLCFAIFNTILYATGTAVITFDDTLQTVFMIFFFTTVGFTVSIPMLLKSGKSVIMLLILSVVMINFAECRRQRRDGADGQRSALRSRLRLYLDDRRPRHGGGYWS